MTAPDANPVEERPPTLFNRRSSKNVGGYNPARFRSYGASASEVSHISSSTNASYAR